MRSSTVKLTSEAVDGKSFILFIGNKDFYKLNTALTWQYISNGLFCTHPRSGWLLLEGRGS